MTIYILLGMAALILVKRIIDNRKYNIKSISGKEALLAYAEGTATLIDVRTPAEIAQGKLDGATEANVTSITFKKQITHLDKTKPYIVYCRSGMRSNKACKIMSDMGFADLTNVSGGYIGMK